MVTNYLFGSYRIWGNHSGGGATAVSVQVFLNISYENVHDAEGLQALKMKK
jgi:hypothetical protein